MYGIFVTVHSNHFMLWHPVRISDRMLAAEIRWTLDEPLNGVRSDIVYKNEESERIDSVFENVVNRNACLLCMILLLN